MKQKIFTMIFTSLIGVMLTAQTVPDPFMRFTFDIDGTDEMGNSWSILHPNASIVDDPVRGKALEVNVDDGFVELDPAVFSDVTDHSIACWTLSYDTATLFQAVFELIADQDNYIILCAPTWKKFYQVHMMNGVGTYEFIPDTTGPLTQNVWHHVAYTCDDGFFTLFLDGEVVDTISSTVTPVKVNADTVSIGMNWQKGRNVGSHALIDNFEFYKSALSVENIQTIYNLSVTGINNFFDKGTKSSLLIYPNPVSDKLHIESKGGELIITNIVGAIIKRQIIQPGITDINMRNIAPGLYLISIDEGYIRKEAKLIVK